MKKKHKKVTTEKISKQSIQIELNELSSALGEMKKSPKEVYKILGNIMIKTTPEKLSKELEEKKLSKDIIDKIFSRRSRKL